MKVLLSSEGEPHSARVDELRKVGLLRDMLDLCDDGSTAEPIPLKVPSKYLSTIIEWLKTETCPTLEDDGDYFRLLVHVNFLDIPAVFYQLCEKIIVDQLLGIRRLKQWWYYFSIEGEENYDVSSVIKSFGAFELFPMDCFNCGDESEDEYEEEEEKRSAENLL